MTTRAASAVVSAYDASRCPVCDEGVLRGPAAHPGYYMACVEHGIVTPNYDPRRIRLFSVQEDDYTDYEAVDLLQRWAEACADQSCPLCVETYASIAPAILQAVEDELDYRCPGCRDERGPRGGGSRCRTCDRYWQRIDGLWFKGLRS